ncbi:predicted protein [Botrytis cinerea T4]|uniref:Uncharacterized protein n=1 Tax=Botryotinia fuckeliana (strain T4) TaxID=999810 RepID=G2YXT8_BOTF4|nr:predicted protein [Botrytis cinerea T4]
MPVKVSVRVTGELEHGPDKNKASHPLTSSLYVPRCQQLGKTLSLGYLHQQELDNNFESAFVPPRDSLSFEFKHSSANSMLFCKILLDNSKLEFNNGTIHCQIEHMYVNRHNEDFASTEHVAWSALMPSLRQEQE